MNWFTRQMERFQNSGRTARALAMGRRIERCGRDLFCVCLDETKAEADRALRRWPIGSTCRLETGQAVSGQPLSATHGGAAQ